MTERFAHHPDVQDAWDVYITAKHLADQTRDFGDGCTAAQLWRRFLNLYEEQIGPEDDNHIAVLAARAKPYLAKLMHIQSVLQKRLNNPGGDFLKNLELIHVDHSIDLMTIQSIAESADCWDGFCDEIQLVMDKKYGGSQ